MNFEHIKTPLLQKVYTKPLNTLSSKKRISTRTHFMCLNIKITSQNWVKKYHIEQFPRPNYGQ